MPQSVAEVMRSGKTWPKARGASGHQPGRLDLRCGQIDDAEHDVLAREVVEHPEIEPGLRGLD